jgi:hypothetical protein
MYSKLATPTPVPTPGPSECTVTLSTVGSGAIEYGGTSETTDSVLQLPCAEGIVLRARAHEGWRFNHFELDRGAIDTTITLPEYELVVEEGDNVTAFFDPAADAVFLPLIERR